MSRVKTRSFSGRPLRVDDRTVALYRFHRSGTGGVARDASGRGLDLQLEGACFGKGGLHLSGMPGVRAICRDRERIGKALRGARGITVEMWLSAGLSFMDYRPVEEPGAAPCSLGWDWGDVIFAQTDESGREPLGARLRYNPAVLFWTAVAARGARHSGGKWFRAPGYMDAPLARGSWHHVAFAWDDGEVRLYLDGAEISTGNSPGYQVCDAPIVIGCDADGSFPFEGVIRELRISRVARGRTYFRRFRPMKEDALRLPELVVAGAPRGMSACLPRRHSDEDLLPHTKVKTTSTRRRLRMWSAPGQRECATFALKCSRPVKGLRVTSCDLAGDAGVIEADCIDVRVVKCIYYPGEGPCPPNMVPVQSGKALLPVLLLHDDRLVKVDLGRETNAVRVFEKGGRTRYYEATSSNPALAGEHDIRDAQTLGPVDLAAGLWQQFTVAVAVGRDARPGVYRGAIDLSARGVTARIDVEMEILSIALPEPALDYSVCHLPSMAAEGKRKSSDCARTFAISPGAAVSVEQYACRMSDLKAHGITNPTVAQSGAKAAEVLRELERQLRVRREEGMSTRRLFALSSVENLAPPQRKRFVKALRALADRYGFKDVACYVVDEPTLCDLEEHEAVFKMVRAAGVKTFAAVDRLYDEEVEKNSALWRKVKECISIVIAGGRLRPKVARAAHAAGMKIYSYGNPQVLPIAPETFRRNYGLALWKAGYDGAINYAYSCSYGLSAWNEFDHTDSSDYRYRGTQGFALSTSNGLVGTVAWEGFAAGVNDVRYVTALIREIKKAKRAGRRKAAREAQQLLDGINPAHDLDRTRRRIAESIMNLRAC